MIRRFLALIACLVVPFMASAERNDARLYVFGNSLLNHLSESSDLTNVPHWINRLALAADKGFAVDGQWGFLRGFADSLPPRANWGFPGVKGGWSPDLGPFSSAGFDTILIAPSNFIQYQQPDVPYDGNNPSGESPLGALLRLVDWLQEQSPQADIVIYEGWSAMDEIISTYPPSDLEFANYHAFNQGAYHAWYLDLMAKLQQARPDVSFRLLPTARILGGLMAEGGLLADMPVEALFTDDAPHGTESLYLLAAMIVYADLYDADLPEGWRPPATLHPVLLSRYDEIAAAIRAAIPKRQTEAPVTVEAVTPVQAAPRESLPVRQGLALPPSGLRPEGAPALGMGLNGLADWSTQYPFIDLMKSARDWVGHLPGQWGGIPSDELRAGGHLDENGWPVSLPAEATRLESVLLTDMPESASYLRGDYLMLYDGEAEFELTGRAKRVRYEPGRARFTYEPGDGLVGIAITALPEDNPIRNIRIIRADHLPLHQAGVLFNPDWIALVEDLRVIRFMDWMMTNGSAVQSWDDRPRLSDATWTAWGVPLEVMLQLANQIGADPWFNMPHMADDDYVRRFAEMVEDRLDPRLKAHVEYSNEVWNAIFPQAQWAAAQAEALWGPSNDGFAQYYGLRAAQVMDIWFGVFGSEAEDRLVRVAATHTGWQGLEVQILQAPLAWLQLGRPPAASFDAYAITGYFGYEMGGDEMAPQVDRWLDASEALAEARGREDGLQRVALREFLREARFDAAFTPMALALQEGSLRETVDVTFPYHAAAARRAGLQLIMYEGGTHLVGLGDRVQDERLTAFLTAFNYTPEMAKLYEILLTGWRRAGGTTFNAFVDVAPASQWGSWGARRHLEDENPRWDMLMAYNATAPADWETRDTAAFANGLFVQSGEGSQRLPGTAEEDILLAGPGDDTLISGGGQDHLHGGTGEDRAVLPGSRSAYSFDREGGLTLAHGPKGTVYLYDIETVVFEARPEQVVPIDAL